MDKQTEIIPKPTTRCDLNGVLFISKRSIRSQGRSLLSKLDLTLPREVRSEILINVNASLQSDAAWSLAKYQLLTDHKLLVVSR